MSVKWIEEGLLLPGKSRAGLARALRRNPSQITRLLSGDRSLKVDEVARIARYLGVGPDGREYIGGAQTNGVPVIDYVAAGQWTDVVDPFPKGDGYEVIWPNGNVSDRSFALLVRGVSMLPEFRELDYIIVDPEINPSPGDYVIAKLDVDELATFKKYRPRGTDKKQRPIVELVPLNEDWPTLIIDAAHPGRIIGVVVEHHRRLRRS